MWKLENRYCSSRKDSNKSDGESFHFSCSFAQNISIKHKAPSHLPVLLRVFPCESRLSLMALLSLIPSGAAAPIPVAAESNTLPRHMHTEKNTLITEHTRGERRNMPAGGVLKHGRGGNLDHLSPLRLFTDWFTFFDLNAITEVHIYANSCIKHMIACIIVKMWAITNDADVHPQRHKNQNHFWLMEKQYFTGKAFTEFISYNT